MSSLINKVSAYQVVFQPKMVALFPRLLQENYVHLELEKHYPLNILCVNLVFRLMILERADIAQIKLLSHNPNFE
jgi:hypothetical protein